MESFGIELEGEKFKSAKNRANLATGFAVCMKRPEEWTKIRALYYLKSALGSSLSSPFHIFGDVDGRGWLQEAAKSFRAIREGTRTVLQFSRN